MENNKLLNTLILIVFMLVLLFMVYLGYVKPERELIELKAKDCVSSSMKPINDMISSSQDYKTEAVVLEMQKERNSKLEKCKSYYDIYLFSSSEKKVFTYNVSKLIETQEIKIVDYIKKVKEIIKKNEEYRKKQNECRQVNELYKKYSECVTSKGGFVWFDDDSDKECLKKYNYKSFNLSQMTCALMYGVK